jgi:hypothetical protein
LFCASAFVTSSLRTGSLNCVHQSSEVSTASACGEIPGNQRWCAHHALETFLDKLSVKPISARARLVDNADASRFRLQSFAQALHVGLRSADLSEQFNLARSKGIRGRDRIVMNIETNIQRDIVFHAGLRAGIAGCGTSAPCGSDSNANPRLIPCGRPASVPRKVRLPAKSGRKFIRRSQAVGSLDETGAFNRSARYSPGVDACAALKAAVK